MKKKFRDTKVGGFLKNKAPGILDQVGDLLPDKGVLGIVKNLISSESPAVQKEFNEKQAEFEKELEALAVEYEKTITERWKADMASDSWLSKNVRPITLLFLMLTIVALAVIDSVNNLGFQVSESYITLFQTLLVTIVVSYFGSRGAEKVMKTIKK